MLKYGTKERLEEKLGWLRQFRERLKDWSEMKQMIDVVLEFVRTQGLYRGAAKDLRKRLRKLPVGASAAQLRDDLTKFVAGQARQLKTGRANSRYQRGDRIGFGKFKTVERDQAKGGFTGLLLALAACVAERTQEVVHESSPEDQNPRRHRVDQDQARRHRGIKTPNRLSSREGVT